MLTDAFLDDDGGTQLIAVEAADSIGHRQSLWFRVGQVWDGGKLRDEPGIWIGYQQEHMKSNLAGPVLLTPALWRELVQAVNDRLNDRSIFPE